MLVATSFDDITDIHSSKTDLVIKHLCFLDTDCSPLHSVNHETSTSTMKPALGEYPIPGMLAAKEAVVRSVSYISHCQSKLIEAASSDNLFYLPYWFQAFWSNCNSHEKWYIVTEILVAVITCPELFFLLWLDLPSPDLHHSVDTRELKAPASKNHGNCKETEPSQLPLLRFHSCTDLLITCAFYWTDLCVQYVPEQLCFLFTV